MEKIIRALALLIPRAVAVWVYRWIAKDMLLEYVGGLPSAEFVCVKLVELFAPEAVALLPAAIDPLTDDPALAFALTITVALKAQGLPLDHKSAAPIIYWVGIFGQADPDLAEPGG